MLLMPLRLRIRHSVTSCSGAPARFVESSTDSADLAALPGRTIVLLTRRCYEF